MPDNAFGARARYKKVVPHPGNPDLFAIEVRDARGQHDHYLTTQSGHTRPFRTADDAEREIRKINASRVLIIGGNAYRLSPDQIGSLQTAPINADGSFSNHEEEWSGDIAPEFMDNACRTALAALQSIEHAGLL